MKRKSFKFEYYKNIAIACVRKVCGINHFKRKKYYLRCILNPLKTNLFIRNELQNNRHFFIARLGDTECRLLLRQEQVNEKMLNRVPDDIRLIAHRSAGMFSTDDKGVKDFHRIYVENMKKVTGFCVWFNIMEDYLVDKYSPDSALLSLDGLESYLFEEPWTECLAGKKVLVVSPFAETIKKQYFEKRKKIFNNEKVLPNFDLVVYKSPYTLLGCKPQYDAWKEVLENMKTECLKLDFDVAIIGCGAYGLPLGGMLYSEGKSVIHAGGVTQIYFGVRGKRWDDRKYMQKFINENWIRPSKNETPVSANKVEKGCYW